MVCKECKYHEGDCCTIANRQKILSCTLESDFDVQFMKICYNCKHWIGGGDWGLTCRKDYYKAFSDGFHKACDYFEEVMYGS